MQGKWNGEEFSEKFGTALFDGAIVSHYLKDHCEELMRGAWGCGGTWMWYRTRIHCCINTFEPMKKLLLWRQMQTRNFSAGGA